MIRNPFRGCFLLMLLPVILTLSVFPTPQGYMVDTMTSSHLIYGSSVYEDGFVTTGSSVKVISEYGTLTTVVYAGGYWEVDCGDPGPNWPQGTSFTVYITGCCAHRGWFGEASGVVSEEENNMGTIVVYPNADPYPPTFLSAPKALQVGGTGVFTVNTTDPNFLNRLKYRFDWDAEGAHENSNYTDLVENGEPVTKTHMWDTPGTYVVKAQANDEWGGQSDWSEGITVIVYEDDDAPEKPVIDGPTKSRRETMCTYTIIAVDPDGDNVSYFIDWGDGSNSGWVGPYQSGEAITVSHSWMMNGVYQIQVKAKDVYEVESLWSDPFTVSIVEPELNIERVSGGIWRVTTVIENIGDDDAINITWDIQLHGGIILFGSETSGVIECLAPGESMTVYSNLIGGLGKTVVEIQAATVDGFSAAKTVNATVFLFYVRI